MSRNNNIEEIIKPAYLFASFLLYFSYFLVIFGLYKIDPVYTQYLSTFIHIFVCGFLVIRFNPFIKSILVPFDKQIVFGSSLLLLMNIFITSELFSNLNLHFNDFNIFTVWSLNGWL